MYWLIVSLVSRTSSLRILLKVSFLVCCGSASRKQWVLHLRGESWDWLPRIWLFWANSRGSLYGWWAMIFNFARATGPHVSEALPSDLTTRRWWFRCCTIAAGLMAWRGVHLLDRTARPAGWWLVSDATSWSKLVCSHIILTLNHNPTGFWQLNKLFNHWRASRLVLLIHRRSY